MSKQIKKNIIAKTILSVLNIAVPILTGSYVVRVLDIDLYTEFNKSMSLLAWFLPFAVFGVNTYGLREISRIKHNTGQVNVIFSEYFFWNIVTSILVFIIYLFFVYQTGSYFSIYFSVSFQILFSFMGVEYVNEAFENYVFILYKNLILRVLYIIFIFLLVKKPIDIIYFTLISTTNVVLNNITSFIYIKRFIRLVKIELIHFKESIKGLFTALILFNSSMLYTTLDRLFLSLFSKNYDITYYSMSQNIMTAVLSIFTSIILVTIPRLSYYYSNKYQNEFDDLLSKSSSLFYLFAIPSCVGICLLGNQVIILYGSAKYIQSGSVLSIFAIRFIIDIVDNVASKQVLFVTGNERFLTKIYFIGGLINSFGNVLLTYLNKLSAISIIITTIFAEIVVIIIEQYKIKTINKKYAAINRQFIQYLLISVSLFYFVINIIFPRIYSSTFSTIMEQLIYIGIIVTVCSVLYGFTLLLLHDKMFLFVIRTIFLHRRKEA